jgi:hypothetical protein
MRSACLLLLALVLVAPAAAQRPFRIGPTVSIIALDEGSGTQQFVAYGGAVALLTGDESETGLTVARYGDLSSNACRRSLTFAGLESYYYPVGARGFAPFASTTVGLSVVTDEDPGLGGVCLPAQPSTEIGIGFGLGARINIGPDVAGLFEGRFFQVPHSAIQTLEARASAVLSLGRPRPSQLLRGTAGPSLAFLAPLGGAFGARGPAVGARFRRDTRKAGTVALDIHYAPLEIREGCSSDCEPHAILFAPGYEASLRPAWGRVYGVLGALIAGFPAAGPDRGITQGAHGGLGVDVRTGPRLLLNVGARALWIQRSGGDSAFLLQIGASVSPSIAPGP